MVVSTADRLRPVPVALTREADVLAALDRLGPSATGHNPDQVSGLPTSGLLAMSIPASFGGADISNLIVAEAEAYLSSKAQRVRLTGAPTALAPEAFSILSLVIHELMTNSAKYGALCDQRGSVTIDWTRDTKGDLIIDWREHDGPRVKPPTRRGFGSRLTERVVSDLFQGQAAIRFNPEGVTFSLVGKLHNADDLEH